MAAQLKNKEHITAIPKTKDQTKDQSNMYGFFTMNNPFIFCGPIFLPEEDEIDHILETIDLMDIEPSENYPVNPTTDQVYGFLKYLVNELAEVHGYTHQEYLTYWIFWTIREYNIVFEEEL